MLEPGTSVGRYVIKRKLAEGGMAEIYLASAFGPEGFAKEVAIKVVHSYLANDSQFVQMFIAEARLASRLNHANVVQIFDFGKHQDSYYLAMEYVRGASLWDLRRRCRDHGVPFPPTLAAEIGAQVARGLQYAHNLVDNGQRIGVVHRDVTPHNVLLSFDGAVKLTDFGIAKATTTHTAPGMLKGKFAYMAPEQARGDKVDARTDLFALGIVIWELLTGGRLFDGDSDLAVLRAVQESLIAPPSRLNADVPHELSDVVMKALSRQPEERFQTAFEMEKALANYVLRNAKSVDDTAVSHFVQQMFREEFEALHFVDRFSANKTLPPENTGMGETHASMQVQTQTGTPMGPSLAQAKTSPTDAAQVQAALPLGDSRPRTERMPALKPSSRRLNPLTPEPSVIVRPSLGALPDLGATTDEFRPASHEDQTEPQTPFHEEPLRVPQSSTPLIVILVLLVGSLVWAVMALTSSGPESSGAEAQKAVAEGSAPAREIPQEKEVPRTVDSEPAQPPPVAEEVAVQPIPETTQEIDAGLAAEASQRPKASSEKNLKTAARKTGFLTIKAVPYATVVIQGKSYEVTGVQKIVAPVGTYEITFIHPKLQTKETVSVQANRTTAVSFAAD